MKSFEQCVREQFEQKLTNTDIASIVSANIKWLTQFKIEIESYPTVDMGQIDYRDAHEELIDKIIGALKV
jgi:hypothetical protein